MFNMLIYVKSLKVPFSNRKEVLYFQCVNIPLVIGAQHMPSNNVLLFNKCAVNNKKKKKLKINDYCCVCDFMTMNKDCVIFIYFQKIL